ncbi:MAG: sulfotransferase family protein [Acidimicrobiales bacterium]
MAAAADEEDEVEIKVVGAGVGRTGTHSLKIALERLLGGPCHHMIEMFGNPEQIAAWSDAIDGKPVDWAKVLENYTAIVDWPGGSFWPELSQAFPDALVLLSVRDPESWYRSASNTIFQALNVAPPELAGWMTKVKQLLAERFCDRFDDEQAMIDAFVRHNDSVRSAVPAGRLLEWRPGDGWEPICDRLGLAVPEEPFPITNTTDEFRQMSGLPPMS